MTAPSGKCSATWLAHFDCIICSIILTQVLVRENPKLKSTELQPSLLRVTVDLMPMSRYRRVRMTDIGYEKFMDWILDQTIEFNYDFKALQEDFGKEVAMRVAVQLCPFTRHQEWENTAKKDRIQALKDCIRRDAESDWDDLEMPVPPKMTKTRKRKSQR